MAVSVAVAVFLRWGLADLADWGLDEAATMWLALLRLGGASVPLGLVSSRHVPNMAGAPVLTIPLALFRSPLAISRALSMTHLAVLLLYARALRRSGAPGTAIPLLLLFPGFLLASWSVWNQYYLLALNVLQVSLLVTATDHRLSQRGRVSALAAFLVIAIFLPAVHLLGFAELAASLLIWRAIVASRAVEPASRVPAIALLLAATIAAVFFYWPWVRWTVRESGSPGLDVVVVVAALGAIVAVHRLDRAMPAITDRFERSAAASRFIVGLLWLFLAEAATLPFTGAQVDRHLMVGRPVLGWLFLAGQVLLVLSLVPRVLRVHKDAGRGVPAGQLLTRNFNSPMTAVVLIAFAALTCLCRLPLLPMSLFWSRPDLLLSAIPKLIAPLLLTKPRESHTAESKRWSSSDAVFAAGIAIVIGTALVIALGHLDATGPAGPRAIVPGSEITAVVDALAAQQRASVDGRSIEVAYDVETGIEHPSSEVCGPGRTWFSPGRQYDWLLQVRHGLQNSREGTCDRAVPGLWQIALRGSPIPEGMRVVRQFDHIEIRAAFAGLSRD